MLRDILKGIETILIVSYLNKRTIATAELVWKHINAHSVHIYLPNGVSYADMMKLMTYFVLFVLQRLIRNPMLIKVYRLFVEYITYKNKYAYTV